MPRMLLAVSCLCGLATLQAETPKDSHWPQWRGPGGSGVSPQADFPVEWNPTTHIRWKSPVPGRGHSSPVVWGGRIFLTTSLEGPVVRGAKAPKHMMGEKEYLHPDSVGADRQHRLKVLCLDRDTGKILWERTAHEGTVYDNRHRKNTYASPTPATDGRYVYAYFGAEGLYCYDFSGKLVWKASLGSLGTMGMGPGTSPVLYENLVIVQCDQEASGEDSFLAAVDKNTGKLVWKTSRSDPASWATPLLVRNGSQVELAASGSKTARCYDPGTGRELWQTGGVEGNAIPSPVAGHGMLFFAAGYPVKRVFGIRAAGSGRRTDVAWRYEKGTAYVPSPILYGDYLYIMTDRGLLTCLDAKTGQVKYEGARVPAPATFFASPVAFNGNILLTSEDGDTFFVKAGPVHEIRRTNAIGEPVYASLALAAGRIFIRGEKNLYCIARP